MVKEKLNELLDSIYELEGLVHLALTRDDNPEHLPELIVRKGEELARRAASVAEADSVAGADLEAEVDSVADADSVAHATAPSSKQEKRAAGFCPGAAGFSLGAAGFCPAAAGFSPIEEDMQSVVESVFNALPVEGNLAENPVEGNWADETEEAGETDEAGSESREPRGKLVFSINDRYRFKRELFNNSDADFNNTLALVASMDGYDEAEDYFLGELQWDSKRGEVIDFLDILKRYFKE